MEIHSIRQDLHCQNHTHKKKINKKTRGHLIVFTGKEYKHVLHEYSSPLSTIFGKATSLYDYFYKVHISWVLLRVSQ